MRKNSGLKKLQTTNSLKNDEGDVQRYIFFKFTEINAGEKHADVLWYSVNVKKDMFDSEPLILHHNVCFSKKGFLIITGMPYRHILLSYLSNLLHPKRLPFKIKYLTKKEIQNFTKNILKKDVNKIYQPRFHFSERYRKREFNDFIVGENECATKDSEYSKMMTNCFYFEPIFTINNINGIEFETKLKVNHIGRFYSSHSLSFEEWIGFIKTYLNWCV